MTKKNIKEAYDIANKHSMSIEDSVQIGLQMAINKEVLFSKDGKIIRID